MNTKKAPVWPLILASCVLLTALFFFLTAVFTAHLQYPFSFMTYGGTFAVHSIEIGSVSLSLYWFWQIVGIVCMTLLCLCRRRRYGIPAALAAFMGVILMIFGFIGAKLLYILENLQTVARNGLTLAGVSFYGTVFFLPAALLLTAVCIRKKPGQFLDYCTPAVPLMLACIRLGCFCNGCCGGITLWLGSRPIVVPVQLLECALDFATVYVLLCAEREEKWQGIRYVLFLGTYGSVRFLLEFLRTTEKDKLGLSNAQWFSLLCVAICMIVLLIRRRSDRKNTEEIQHG